MMIDSFVSKGILLDPEMFSAGDNPHGWGYVVRTTYQGLRASVANYLPGAGENLTLKTKALVDRIVFGKNFGTGEIKVMGVEVIDSDGKKHTFTTRKRMIVSRGAYCSPAILLRSVVGPKAELEGLEIEVVVNSPSARKNLMDHLVRNVIYALTHPVISSSN